MKQTNWTVIGVARWYDWKLGKLSDRDLARVVGTTEGSIRRRRVQFGIEVYSVAVALAPFQHLLGLESDRSVSAKSGVSVKSIQAYRKSQGIAPRSKVTRRIQRLPLDHPVRPYKSALGLVPDEGVVCGRGRNPTLRLWPTIFSGKIDVFPGDRRSRLISSMTSVAPA